MNQDFKKRLKKKFKESTNRNPKGNEIVNMESDSNLTMKVLIELVEDLDKRIKKLE